MAYTHITSQLPEAFEEQLYEVFTQFCAFGASRNSNPNLSGSLNNLSSGPQIDNVRFSKFFRDLKVLNKELTPTDIDIIFNKVKKTKTDRKLDFDCFKNALVLCSEKKYRPKMDGYQAYEKIVTDIVSKDNAGPLLHGTRPEASGVYSKLTDHTLYTGSHKERFDEEGRGKGVAGRNDSSIGVKRLDKLVSRDPAVQNRAASMNQTNKRGISASMEAMDAQGPTKSIKNLELPNDASLSHSRSNSGASSNGLNKSNSNLTRSKSSGLSGSSSQLKTTVPQVPAGSVFDRLTDVKKYHGAHKHRFNEDGSGKGKAGRVQEVGPKKLESFLRN